MTETDPLLLAVEPLARFIGCTPETRHELLLRYREMVDRRWVFEINRLWDEQEETE